MDQNIAIIIPAFNAASTLPDTLASVFRQTRRVQEVIVVDDGSSDDTAAIAARFRSVTVLSKANGGQGSARELGGRHSKADFLLFLDADDLLLPHAIEQLLAASGLRPDAWAVYGRAELFSSQPIEVGRVRVELPDAEGDVWRPLLEGNFVRTPGCALLRRSALSQVGGWDADPALKGHEDWDLWLRLAEQGPFVRVAATVLKYRVHPASFTARRLAMRRSVVRLYAKHASRWDQNSERGRLVAQMYTDMRRRCSSEFWAVARDALLQGRFHEAAGVAAEAFRFWPRSLFWPIRGCRRLSLTEGRRGPSAPNGNAATSVCNAKFIR